MADPVEEGKTLANISPSPLRAAIILKEGCQTLSIGYTAEKIFRSERRDIHLPQNKHRLLFTSCVIFAQVSSDKSSALSSLIYAHLTASSRPCLSFSLPLFPFRIFSSPLASPLPHFLPPPPPFPFSLLGSVLLCICFFRWLES